LLIEDGLQQQFRLIAVQMRAALELPKGVDVKSVEALVSDIPCLARRGGSGPEAKVLQLLPLAVRIGSG
jgi:hypothetical protein